MARTHNRMASTPQIAITRTSAANLTLARLFHVLAAKVTITLYELDTSPTFCPKPVPLGCKWEYKKGLTLMGGAVSLMTPLGGGGVKRKMKDALELAELIEKSQDLSDDLTLDQAVLCYQSVTFPQS